MVDSHSMDKRKVSCRNTANHAFTWVRKSEWDESLGKKTNLNSNQPMSGGILWALVEGILSGDQRIRSKKRLESVLTVVL